MLSRPTHHDLPEVDPLLELVALAVALIEDYGVAPEVQDLKRAERRDVLGGDALDLIVGDVEDGERGQRWKPRQLGEPIVGEMEPGERRAYAADIEHRVLQLVVVQIEIAQGRQLEEAAGQLEQAVLRKVEHLEVVGGLERVLRDELHEVVQQVEVFQARVRRERVVAQLPDAVLTSVQYLKPNKIRIS